MAAPFRILCAVGLVLTLTGCTVYRARPVNPQAEIALLRAATPDVVIVDRVKANGVPSHAGAAPRFDLTDGLSDAEVVAVALTLNPGLRAKRLEIGEAQAQLITAGLWPNPEVGFSWQAGVGGAGGFKLGGDMLFELLRVGERTIRKRSSEAKVTQVRQDIVAEEYRVVAEVRGQRLTILGAEQGTELLRQEVAIRRRAAGLVRQRRQIGEGTDLEVSASELELAESQRDLRKAEAELHRERQGLNRLMGLPPEYSVRLEDSGRPLRITLIGELSGEELDRRMIAGRPELQAKEAEYQRAERDLELAVLGQYPRVRVGPSFERDLDGSKSLGVGLSLELPLFNRNQGEIAERTAQRDRLRGEYVALLHRLRADAAGALAALRRAQLEVQTQEQDVLPLVKRNQDLFEGAFKAREVGILDWIVVQQRAFRAKREHLESLVGYGKVLIELEAALGRPLGQALPQPATAPAAASKPK